MHSPRHSPRHSSQRRSSQGFRTEDKLWYAVRSAQEATARDTLQRSYHLVKGDVDTAWKVLVPSGESSISKSELVEQLSLYLPHVDTGTAGYLVGGGGSYSADKLRTLLLHDGQPTLPCNMSDEAYKQLDPHGRGSVGLDSLLRMLSTVEGCEKLDDDDIEVIRLLLDLSPEDADFTEENWRQLGSWAPKREVLTPAQRKLLVARTAATKKGGGHKSEQPMGKGRA